MAAATKGGDKAIRRENEHTLRDGRRVWVLWTYQPIFDTEGNLKEMASVLTAPSRSRPRSRPPSR